MHQGYLDVLGKKHAGFEDVLVRDVRFASAEVDFCARRNHETYWTSRPLNSLGEQSDNT